VLQRTSLELDPVGQIPAHRAHEQKHGRVHVRVDEPAHVRLRQLTLPRRRDHGPRFEKLKGDEAQRRQNAAHQPAGHLQEKRCRGNGETEHGGELSRHSAAVIDDSRRKSDVRHHHAPRNPPRRHSCARQGQRDRSHHRAHREQEVERLGVERVLRQRHDRDACPDHEAGDDRPQQEEAVECAAGILRPGVGIHHAAVH